MLLVFVALAALTVLALGSLVLSVYLWLLARDAVEAPQREAELAEIERLLAETADLADCTGWGAAAIQGRAPWRNTCVRAQLPCGCAMVQGVEPSTGGHRWHLRASPARCSLSGCCRRACGPAS